MIKLFRKIRQKMLTENKFSKYLIYASGEIVLVVLGILLALQINTLNNESITRSNLEKIYEQIQTDLKIDTTLASQYIINYNEKDKRIQDIMDHNIKPSFYDTITSLNYKDCSICSSESTNYEHFIPRTKGYNLLKNAEVSSIVTKDSLPNIINDFYLEGIPAIQQSFLNVQNIAFENIKNNQQYSWFTDWSQRKFNEEFLIYLFESEEYRKQLGRYRIYTKYNYIRQIESYKQSATDILELVELELESK